MVGMAVAVANMILGGRLTIHNTRAALESAMRDAIARRKSGR